MSDRNAMSRIAIFLCSVAAVAQVQDQSGLDATLWMQSSAEYRALSRQVYRAAEQALERGLRTESWTAALEQNPPFTTLPPAVVLDLDETVLDNTPFQAALLRDNLTYTEDLWQKWVTERRAGLVPGALEFLIYARTRGVNLVYVTNRVCQAGDPNDATVQNLQALGVPLAVENLHCRTAPKESSAKGPRRLRVARQFRILLLIGDDLNDFLTIPPDAATVPGRFTLTDAHQRLFGERWFIIPNPDYGSWERTVGFSIERKLSGLRP